MSPQARPIENFRVCLAQKADEGSWEANTEQLLIRPVLELRYDVKMLSMLPHYLMMILKNMLQYIEPHV